MTKSTAPREGPLGSARYASAGPSAAGTVISWATASGYDPTVHGYRGEHAAVVRPRNRRLVPRRDEGVGDRRPVRRPRAHRVLHRRRAPAARQDDRPDPSEGRHRGTRGARRAGVRDLGGSAVPRRRGRRLPTVGGCRGVRGPGDRHRGRRGVVPDGRRRRGGVRPRTRRGPADGDGRLSLAPVAPAGSSGLTQASRTALPLACACALRSAWKATIFACSSGSDAPRIRAARSPALRALPMATVATGTPAGICTIDSSESIPSRYFSGTGTPITGSGVTAASMPGRCAAPPAPAMITRRSG